MSPAGKTGRYMGFNAMFNSIGRAFGPSVGTYIMYTFHYNGLITWSLIGVFGVLFGPVQGGLMMLLINAYAAYTLLSMMIKASKKLFGKFVKTIGECSRAIKEVLILKKNYKWRLFSV